MARGRAARRRHAPSARLDCDAGDRHDRDRHLGDPPPVARPGGGSRRPPRSSSSPSAPSRWSWPAMAMTSRRRPGTAAPLSRRSRSSRGSLSHPMWGTSATSTTPPTSRRCEPRSSNPPRSPPRRRRQQGQRATPPRAPIEHVRLDHVPLDHADVPRRFARGVVGTVVAQGSGTLDGRPVTVLLLQAGDGSRSLGARFLDSCEIRDLGSG